MSDEEIVYGIFDVINECWLEGNNGIQRSYSALRSLGCMIKYKDRFVELHTKKDVVTVRSLYNSCYIVVPLYFVPGDGQLEIVPSFEEAMRAEEL